MFMLLAMRIGFRRQHARGPLAIGTIIDILALERIFPAIEIHLILTNGRAGHGHQILGDRNVNRRITWQAPWTGNDLTDFFHSHGLVSLVMCTLPARCWRRNSRDVYSAQKFQGPLCSGDLGGPLRCRNTRSGASALLLPHLVMIIGIAPIIATTPPSSPEEKNPFPLSRSLKWHPTPTFSSNQEKFVIVNFDVKNNL